MTSDDESGRFYLGAYWGSRASPAGEIARTAAEFYRSIRELHPLLAEMVVSKKGAERTLLTGEPGRDSLAILGAMQNDDDVYRDQTGAPISFGEGALKKAGFVIGLYPLRESLGAESIDVSINAGSFDVPGLGNAVTVTLPASASFDARNLPLTRQMLNMLIRYWAPAFALLTSYDFLEAVEDEKTSAHVGWLNYFSDFSNAPALDVYTIERDGVGAYVQLVETPASDFDAEVRRAIGVRKKLVSANVLNHAHLSLQLRE
jgi:hypothetical protein